MTMAEEKSNASTVTTKEANGDTAETPTKAASSSNGHDQVSAKATEVAPNEKQSKVVTTDPPEKRRLSFKKMVPLFVLLLAAVILFGIIGRLESLGWRRGLAEDRRRYPAGRHYALEYSSLRHSRTSCGCRLSASKGRRPPGAVKR